MYTTFISINKTEPTKAYVGMTGKTNPKYRGSGRYFLRAVKKYGYQNFDRVDLGSFETADEAHYWEGFYIKTLKTLVADGGYNVCPNGGSPFVDGYNHTDASKQKMSASKLGKPTWNKWLGIKT